MFDDIFSRLDTVHERDGQTDGWTPADSKDRAITHSVRRAVKTTLTFAHAPLYPVMVSFQSEYG